MKDLIVKLEIEQDHHQSLDFAISVAEAFNAHIAGVAFGSLAGLPNYSMIGVPGDVVGQIMAESEQMAGNAITRFEAAAKRSELTSESISWSIANMAPPKPSPASPVISTSVSSASRKTTDRTTT